MPEQTRICFVCLGNICRSPTAEGIFRHLVAEAGLEDRFVVDSAGTGAYHVGEPPDRRATTAARKRGITLQGAARQFHREDFARFDHIIAMDRSNHDALVRLAPDAASRDKVQMMRSFDPNSDPDDEVPDPYYGGSEGYERVVEICDAACRGLLASLR